jgi:hypothetical protein
VAHQPFSLKLPDGAELLIRRHLGVDSMELPEVDSVQSEPLETSLQLSAQELGPPVLHPLIRSRPPEPTLGRDHQARVRVQRLGDELLATCGP